MAGVGRGAAQSAAEDVHGSGHDLQAAVVAAWAGLADLESGHERARTHRTFAPCINYHIQVGQECNGMNQMQKSLEMKRFSQSDIIKVGQVEVLE